jgi:hypothetical protein
MHMNTRPTAARDDIFTIIVNPLLARIWNREARSFGVSRSVHCLALRGACTTKCLYNKAMLMQQGVAFVYWPIIESQQEAPGP